ncbi:ParB N-terminal domain-containing protein [Chroococcidiopsis sp. TS-821]|uniref:ParB/RepB/Spo0J family partition protein n=1 Tax=Chroococcidiopsis sp. TS-821 TaxID=1378066 RepID=UPI000CEE5330|nr:ParB N-terminal domain-containing protein [Chroococcidiopsis sp. TS-821]PPS42073.1 chromosome partitioning protein ParB [Chroococcidiopsis sp. TS-821]
MREPKQELESIFHKLVPLDQLKPHPRNTSIYGDDEDVSDLVDLISCSGWIKPLVVTPSSIIISGHRRWKAAIKLGLETVPCVEREFPDELAELQALLLENASRQKTNEQKVREGKAWESIESELAKARKLATQNNNTARAEWKNFSTLVNDFGRVRDRIAQRVGLGSGVTYSKAAKVVELIDQSIDLDDCKQAAALRLILNEQSINAAYRVIRESVEKRQYVIDKIASGEVSVKCGIALLKSDRQLPSPSVAASTEADEQELSSSSGNRGKAASDRADNDNPYKSCWNCHWRGKSIDNQTIYCYQHGTLNMVEKDGFQRALECEYWQEHTISHHKADFGKGDKPFVKYTVYLAAQLAEAVQQRAYSTNNLTIEKYIHSLILADLEKADSNANHDGAVIASGLANDSITTEQLVPQQGDAASELNRSETSSPILSPDRIAPLTTLHFSREQN